MQNNIEIPIVATSDDCLPRYASDEAAGADVKACLKEDLVVKSGKSATVPTGIKVAIPTGFEIQVRPRSGLAAKNQISVLNTPGTIDSDYRGEIHVILINHGDKDFVVTNGMRIAQLIVAPVYQASFVKVESLEETARGAGGFGHTGTH